MTAVVGPSAPRFSDEDYPALFRSSDQASLHAQRRYMTLYGINLSLIILGGALGLVSNYVKHQQQYAQALAAVSALAFVGGLVLTVVLKKFRLERAWYDGRALAESVKTLAWRYMMASDPFAHDMPARDATGLFTNRLTELLREHQHVATHLIATDGTAPQVTQRMRQTRELSCLERRDFYLLNRIADQRAWYSERAAAKRKAENRWLLVIIIAQAAAVASAVSRIAVWNAMFNPTGFFASLSTAFMAWLQVKRHQELGQAYNVAAHELGMIAESAAYVDDDPPLSVFVADAESAMSREHALWIARRRGR